MPRTRLLLALTAAFGLPEDPAEAAAEIEERERTAPLGLGPVHILHAEDPNPGIAVRPSASAREIAWTCRCEDGDEKRGRSALDSEAGKASTTLSIPAGLPLGYHRLAVEAGDAAAELDLIVAPAACYLPAQLADGAQLGLDLSAIRHP